MDEIKKLENIFEELNFLNLFDSDGIISNCKIKEKGFGSEVSKSLFNKGCIQIRDIKDFPHCDYEITEKGREYLFKIGELVYNQNSQL